MPVIRLGIAALSLWFANSALAQTTFPAGSTSKATGMESSLTTMGPPALFYNPANLSDSGTAELFSELGYTQVNLSYEHPDFDQVNVRVRTPYGTMGFVKGYDYDRWHMGLVIYPVQRGSQKISGLPRRVAGKYTALDVENYEENLKFGVGGSYKFDQGTSVGVSLIEGYEHKKIKAKTPHSSEELIDLDGKNYFTRPVFGIYHQFSNFRFSMAYLPGLKKSYNGSQKAAYATKKTKPSTVGYEPTTLSFGLGSDWDYFSAATSLNYKLYSKGRKIFQEGVTSATQSADLHDIVEYSVELGYRISRTVHMTASYAVLPSPWGAGKYSSSAKNEDKTDEEIGGVDFGAADAVDRRVIGVGLGSKLPGTRANLHSSLMHSQGERNVAEGGDHPGFYQVDIWTISTELTYPF